MKNFQSRIYGRWFDEKMEFFFSEDGSCEIKWLKENDKTRGLYEISNDKLIITYGNGNSIKWIAKIINLDDSIIEVIDLNGDNINGIEKFTRKKDTRTNKNNQENSKSSDRQTILKFYKNNTITPFGCVGGIIIVAFVLVVIIGAYEGIVEIFSILPTWLSTILNLAPLIGIIFYINRDK